MGYESWIAILGCVCSFVVAVVAFLNFRIFSKQLSIAQEQIATTVRQLELAQKAPDLQFIPRSIADSSDHLRILLEKPYLRPYFYDDVAWKEGDPGTRDEVLLMSELILNNFVSSVMHSAAFPQYPVRGIDRIIAYHLRHSPALREFLSANFERFPFSGLTLLCFKARTRDEVVQDLRALAGAPGLDTAEITRRGALLRLFEESPHRDPIEFAAVNMEKRQ